MRRLNAQQTALLLGATPGQSLRLLLNLFPEEQPTALLDRWTFLGPRRLVARGRVEGSEASLVVLSLNEDVLSGSVLIPGRGIFQIQPAGDGWHRVAEMDEALIPRCGVRASSGLRSTAYTPAFRSAAEPDGGTNMTVIDLLVVYTSQARAGAGDTNGINSLIDDAVEEANAAYENSQVNVRLRLVYRGEIDYRETGDISEDLDELEDDEPEEPGLQAVHALRAQYGADLVCLMTETTGGPLGLANLMRDVRVDFSEHAFSVVQRQYANAYQVLAHELGHLMGCQHDRDYSTGPGAFPYSYARRFTVNELTYHTVMAPQPGLPIPYFSNPDVSFLGEPTGVPETFTNAANNAKTINLTAPTVAAFSTLLRTGVPPRITLVTPINGAFLRLPTQVQLLATASDDDGNVEEVDFYVNGTKVSEIHEPPFAVAWSNAAPGTYSVRATARDNSGEETRSDTALFTLAFPPPAFDLAGCRFVAGGQFILRAIGAAGLDYAITSSGNLIDWTPLTSGFFTNDFFEFLDPTPTNAPRHFYHITRQP